MANDTPKEYWQTVEDIAKEALDEHGDEDEARDYITESVDGSYWVIYYHANEVVLETSKNEPDGDEVAAMAGPDADWRKMRMIAAYMAMEIDVMEALDDLVKEREEAAEAV